jgi:hypothetical protein
VSTVSPTENNPFHKGEERVRGCAGSRSEATKRNLTRVDEDCIDFDALESLLEHIDAQYEPGAILVFLPGMGEISKIYERLAATSRFSPHKVRGVAVESTPLRR